MILLNAQGYSVFTGGVDEREEREIRKTGPGNMPLIEAQEGSVALPKFGKRR